MRYKILIVWSLLIFSFSCSGTKEELLPEAPTNLTAEITIDSDNTLQVFVNSSAQKANYYVVYWGDDSDLEQNNTGTFSHLYKKAGNYKITINAHTTNDVSVAISEQVELSAPIITDFPTKGYSTPLAYEGYNLVWQDEFEGTTLSSNWTYEIGTGGNGWGNNELQYYRKENTSIKEGFLVIEAKKESFSGQQYTSSRLISEGKKSFKYGRIDIRAALPEGQGIWPALWMLGSNFSQVGWPKCGEIDIMEMIGGNGRENNVFGTLHWDNNGSYACTCGQGNGYTLPSGTFADEFHVFSIIWDETKIEWLVDDNSFKIVDISPTGLDEFKEEFFFILNIAVGGNLPGSPNSSTTFPQRMAIDYIRVFQKP